MSTNTSIQSTGYTSFKSESVLEQDILEKANGLLQKAILNFKNNLEHKKGLPDYQKITGLGSLIGLAEDEELINEIKTLLILFNQRTDIEARFKELCKAREAQNRDTTFSFSARPEGTCNQLYYNLASILFNPQSPEEFLSVLLPSVTKSLTIRAQPLSKNRNGLVITGLQIASLSAAFWDGSNEHWFIQQCVIHGDFLFNMAQIAYWPIDVHLTFYNSLTDLSLRKKIYGHNDATNELERDIQFLSGHCISLKEMMRQTIAAFKQGGDFFTADASQASYQADLAGQNFREYIESYSEKARHNILSIKSIDRIADLDRVYRGLLNKECVTRLTVWLEEILRNPLNESFLVMKPTSSIKQEREIQEKYKKPIEINGAEKSSLLPDKLIEPQLQQIYVMAPEGLQELLLTISEEYYSIFIKNLNFNYPIENNIEQIFESLGSIKKQASLLIALFENRENRAKKVAFQKIFNNLLICTDSSNNASLLKSFFETLNENSLINFLDDEAEGLISTLLKCQKSMRTESTERLFQAMPPKVFAALDLTRNREIKIDNEYADFNCTHKKVAKPLLTLMVLNEIKYSPEVFETLSENIYQAIYTAFTDPEVFTGSFYYNENTMKYNPHMPFFNTGRMFNLLTSVDDKLRFWKELFAEDNSIDLAKLYFFSHLYVKYSDKELLPFIECVEDLKFKEFIQRSLTTHFECFLPYVSHIFNRDTIKRINDFILYINKIKGV